VIFGELDTPEGAKAKIARDPNTFLFVNRVKYFT
jgi:hypothetical protein